VIGVVVGSLFLLALLIFCCCFYGAAGKKTTQRQNTSGGSVIEQGEGRYQPQGDQSAVEPEVTDGETQEIEME